VSGEHQLRAAALEREVAQERDERVQDRDVAGLAGLRRTVAPVVHRDQPALEIDVGRLRTYELPYADMFNASHSCYGTLEYALIGLDAEPQIRFGPMEPNDKPIDLAFAAMLVLTADVIHSVDLAPDRLASLDAELKKLGERRQSYKR
jgi:hypothetical protein